jgi:hypothetical protein
MRAIAAASSWPVTASGSEFRSRVAQRGAHAFFVVAAVAWLLLGEPPMDGNDMEHDRWMNKITNVLRNLLQANLRKAEEMRAQRPLPRCDDPGGSVERSR